MFFINIIGNLTHTKCRKSFKKILFNKIFFRPRSDLRMKLANHRPITWPAANRRAGLCSVTRHFSARPSRFHQLRAAGAGRVGGADCLCEEGRARRQQREDSEEGVSRGLGPSILSCELCHCTSRPVTSDSVYRTFPPPHYVE